MNHFSQRIFELYWIDDLCRGSPQCAVWWLAYLFEQKEMSFKEVKNETTNLYYPNEILIDYQK